MKNTTYITEGKLTLYYTDNENLIELDDLSFNCGIDLLLYFKAIFYKEYEIARNIGAIASPCNRDNWRERWYQIKNALRYIQTINTKEWENACRLYLLQVLFLTAEYRKNFVDSLLETSGELVSVGTDLLLDNGYDIYQRKQLGAGENLLGKTLETVRNLLQDEKN